MTENIQAQQVTLLARKALLLDEIKQIEATLGQLSAIITFVKQNPAAPAEPAPTASA